MYEEIDEAHRHITAIASKAGDDYSRADGYLYSRNPTKKAALLDTVSTFGLILSNILQLEGIDARYDLEEVAVRGAPDYIGPKLVLHVDIKLPHLGKGGLLFGNPWIQTYSLEGKCNLLQYRNSNIYHCVRTPYPNTESLVHNLKLLVQYANANAQCTECHYSDFDSDYCGLGLQLVTDTCTQRIPLLGDSHV